MKKVLLTFLLCLTILPLGVNAASKKYNTLNLDEALTQENIEHDFSNYKETDKQITIYLFRGNGCGFCQRFLTFLNSIIDEYGQYFKVVSYETWYDRDNANLMTEVSNFLGQPATGVPYIIIGDQVFAGYSSNYDDAIKEAITNLYNQKEKDRYDVFKEMEKAEKNANATTEVNYFVLIFANVVIIAFMGGISLIYMTKQHKILNSKLNAMNAKLELIESKSNTTKEVKTIEKEVKQKTKAKKN